MNLKRLFLGIASISLGLFLIIPKPNLEFLNWFASVRIVLSALVPLLFLIYGFLWLRDSYDIALPSEVFDRGTEEDQVEPFETSSDWDSENDWKGAGVEIHEGEVEGNVFKIKEGETFSHYMKQFKSVKLNKIEIKLSIPDEERSEVWLRVKTSDSPEFEDIKHQFSCELKDGKFEEELNLDWGEYTYFKILPERENSQVDSPEVLNVRTE